MTGKLNKIALGALALATFALPAAARDSDDHGYKSSKQYNDNDMDRYGHDEFERGYRLGRGYRDRDDRSNNDRYGSDRYGSTYGSYSGSNRYDYDRGYRRGRDDERRSGSDDRRGMSDDD